MSLAGVLGAGGRSRRDERSDWLRGLRQMAKPTCGAVVITEQRDYQNSLVGCIA